MGQRVIYIKIGGIHCEHCITTIEQILNALENVSGATVRNNIAEIHYEGEFDIEHALQVITKAGYVATQDSVSENRKTLLDRMRISELVIILFIVLFLGWILRKIFGINLLYMIPEIDSSITYGMLFVTGLLTSIHCVGMCGALNLTAAIESNQIRNMKRPLLYNMGRVISYTIIGGIAGLVGNFLSINSFVSSVIILAAGICMLLMSLKMIGLIDFRARIGKRICIPAKRRNMNSLVIGLCNGFMPCGPLQAMQLYAFSTGNFAMGALSMFLFSIGTVPLMFCVGMLTNILKGKGRMIINRIAATLILILSVVMLYRGLLALGLNLSVPLQNDYSEYEAAYMEEDYQVVEINLDYSGYQDIIVQKGVEVHFIIHVEPDYLTGCNNEVICKEFGFDQKLQTGENEIIFTPEEEGTYVYTCWMNMLKNNILVIDDETFFDRSRQTE